MWVKWIDAHCNIMSLQIDFMSLERYMKAAVHWNCVYDFSCAVYAFSTALCSLLDGRHATKPPMHKIQFDWKLIQCMKICIYDIDFWSAPFEQLQPTLEAYAFTSFTFSDPPWEAAAFLPRHQADLSLDTAKKRMQVKRTTVFTAQIWGLTNVCLMLLACCFDSAVK